MLEELLGPETRVKNTSSGEKLRMTYRTSHGGAEKLTLRKKNVHSLLMGMAIKKRRFEMVVLVAGRIYGCRREWYSRCAFGRLVSSASRPVGEERVDQWTPKLLSQEADGELLPPTVGSDGAARYFK